MSQGDPKRLVVGNLSYNVTEDDLKEALEKHVPVESVHIPKRRNGRSAGLGLVDFKTVEDAQKIQAELNETEFLGRKCYFQFDDGKKGRGRDSHDGRDRERSSRRYDRRDRDRRDYRHSRDRRSRRYDYSDYDDYSDHGRYSRRGRYHRDDSPRRRRDYSPEPHRRRDRRSSSEDSS